MDINDLHPPDDYSHRFFIWHEWIQANGPLTSENVFEYFATSMFYDKQSNNQVLRMQTMHTGVPIQDEAAELRRFTGIEFAVVHAQPPTFFVIQKRERLDPENVRPLAAYFIMNNRIYQSPDVYTVISNRLLTSLSALQSSLDVLRRHRPDYTPRTGFVWPITDPSLTTETSKRPEAESNILEAPAEAEDVEGKASDTPKRQQNMVLLLNAMNTTARHSSMSLPDPSLTEPVEIPEPETPGTATMRSSETPAPTPQEPPKASTSQEPPVKGQPGAGKKKRKRTSMAPPVTPAPG